ncbi:antibiotic biosynthesis monooxygenase [Deinococcus aerius]|uniref:Antibiotic biosynthesis monooxygenase n=1 Tax=Deinococcus aerius TaxID=200253 RepID=A0A2I9D1X7_9DEIO|nr:antibiotic biosynthesis monooxygenase [Deinococcus aerius]GBF04060.1 antibiotic biosynthesis monooxygenase [Deinococcus aerius]
MVLEIALLNVRPGQTGAFESAFARAEPIISRVGGYVRHELHKCLEDDHKYALLVWWETLEDHTVGFRGSAGYQEWRSLLHHFYDPFPTVEHFVRVSTP